MKGNIKMDSLELQKNFHTVYKDFFNTHNIVLSGDGVLTWWADISHGVSALRIKQKLPIKTFCWVNFNTSGKITFRTVFHYSSVENVFKEDKFAVFFKYDVERITLFLQNFLTENGFSGWMEIDFLAETPRWHGFSFSWVISVLLTYLLYIVTGKLDPKVLKGWEFSVDDPIFNELYCSTLNLSHCISLGKSTGASNFTVMIPNTSLPVVYISKKNAINHTDDICTTDNDMKTISSSETAVYKNVITNFLWMDNAANWELPLDYGIIFTGMEYNMFGEIELKKEWAKRENDHLDAFVSDMIRLLPVKDEDRTILSDLLRFDKSEISRKNIDSTNLKILEWFDYLLKNSYNENALNAFINTMKNIGFMSFSYQKENRLFFALQYLFYQYRQFEDEEIGIIPFNTGKIGGSFFFVMKDKRSRTTLQKVLEHLQDDNHIISLDYASWRDGFSSDGVQLRQFITEKIYSDYTKEWNIFFTDSSGMSYFGNYDSVIENEKDCILLDTISGRIYIRGTKLTSKDIHSQNTTIDMMKILLENLGKEVSNTKLPVSTYSQNKNEILGKVVLPLKKLAKEYFWEELSLICSWWITDYYLRLERDESIRIGIIKKIWN